jgi:hypothetical protein
VAVGGALAGVGGAGVAVALGASVAAGSGTVAVGAATVSVATAITTVGSAAGAVAVNGTAASAGLHAARRSASHQPTDCRARERRVMLNAGSSAADDNRRGAKCRIPASLRRARWR